LGDASSLRLLALWVLRADYPKVGMSHDAYDEQRGMYSRVLYGNDTYELYSLPVRPVSSGRVWLCSISAYMATGGGVHRQHDQRSTMQEDDLWR
jgi:hypothetical protein